MNRYRALMEAEFDAFIAAQTMPARDARVPARTLYRFYRTWSEAGTSPVPPMEESLFGRIGSERLVRRRTPEGQEYLGVRLVG